MTSPDATRAQVITFGSKKGGVGKTTLSFNVAASLGAADFRVLIVDVDSQSPTTRTFGATPGHVNLATLLRTPLGEPMATSDAIIRAVAPGVDVLNAAHDDLEMARQHLDTLGALGSKALRRVLDPVMGEYDFVIIDTPPELGGLQASAVIASDWAIAVSRPAEMDLVPTLQFVTQVQQLHLAGESNARLLGVVWNFFDPKAEETEYQIERLSQAYPDLPIFESSIRTYKDLSKANAMNTTAAQGFQNYPSGQSVLAFAIEVMQHIRNGTTPPTAAQAMAAIAGEV